VNVPKAPAPDPKCQKCGTVMLFGTCSRCAAGRHAHEAAVSQKSRWDNSRKAAHRRWGTALERCGCGHHLLPGESGACAAPGCACPRKPGCASNPGAPPKTPVRVP